MRSPLVSLWTVGVGTDGVRPVPITVVGSIFVMLLKKKKK